MLVITNPGTNLPNRLIDKYAIALTPVRINADGVLHEVRELGDLTAIDALVRHSKVHPFILGTSAAEMVKALREFAERSREMIITTSSRKLIGTYDASLAAVRTLSSLPAYSDVRVSVIDTRGGDVSAGLVTLFCAASAKASISRGDITEAVPAIARSTVFTFVPATLDYLVKGGRASFLKAMAANLLNKLPLLGFIDGEVKSIATLSRSDDIASAMADDIAERLGSKAEVWAAVSHGNNPMGASRVAEALRARLDVKFLFILEMAPGYYLNSGPGTLCAAAVPISLFPWPLEVN